jgi:hypothetical protein
LGGDPVNLSDPNGEPGVPAGAECETSTKYKHERPKLCKEVEAAGNEGIEAIDLVCQFADGVPIAGEGCDAFEAAKEGYELYEAAK